MNGQCIEKLSVHNEPESVFTFAGIRTYAEYIAVDNELVAAKPQSLDMITAAAVPLAATTAWQSLVEGCQVKAGDRVLIHNAAGGVGSFAVQIAKALGAYVIGTASKAKEAYVKGLGVDQFIDYRSQRFEEVIEAVVEDVDCVLAAVGGDDILQRSLSVIRPGGHLISLLDDMDADIALAQAVNYQRWWVMPNASDLQQIAKMIDNDEIKMNIDQVFPLAQVAQAHALSLSQRARGKIVLNVAG